jgi:GntR family transcriptional regulator/MocR family aminotransferase
LEDAVKRLKVRRSVAARGDGSAIAAVALDPASKLPMHRQLYEALRAAVLSRDLPAGARLSSTREMSASLGVSRNTVMTAFEQLLAEGYLEGRVGSGTFVTKTLPDDVLRARDATAAPSRTPASGARRLSSRGATLVALPATVSGPGTSLAFRTGLPALDAFPFEVWSRYVARRWRRASHDLLGYADSAGHAPLREAIAQHLAHARGVRCEAAQVVIVSGSQQALDLSARLLLEPGDEVWMEEPGYHGARAALAGAGARLVHVPVDGEGIDVAAGLACAPRAALAYVSPSHQYPLGVTMSLTRRLALLDWARTVGAWILEDDYDSEYRYTVRPLAALQGLDTDGRVIYMGTFSKVMLPSLRLGYLVLPPDLVDVFTRARAVADRHSPSVEQAALSDFILDGELDRHIRRMRMLYASRQHALVDAAAAELGGLLDVKPSPTGMHLVGTLASGTDDVALSQRASALRVEAPALSLYYARPTSATGLVLGYAAVPEDEMRPAARRLAAAFAAPAARATR